jgi:signal transduction histidine kinase
MTKLDLQYTVSDKIPDSNNELRVYIFRIIQELLSNGVKHAMGSKVTLKIDYLSGNIVIAYNDDGPGFTPDYESKGIGLGNMRERIILLNGKIRTNTTPGYGTDHEITIPWC